ncbi:MAG: BolA family transcriptional regulator [Rhodospirillaceae bacterium]|nr:BolA family transcriptional regulator [Rhodospirillaceae bacterium]
MKIKDIIKKKIIEQLEPLSLSIRDDSNLHIGHVGAKPEGETHFHIDIVAEVFRGKSRVESQRIVFRVLKEEMDNKIHALSISAHEPPD